MYSRGFHLLGPCYYPLVLGGVLYYNCVSLVLWFEYGSALFLFVLLGFFGTVGVLSLWLSDVVSEGLSGFHTSVVQCGLRLGFFLFLFTELMFFVSVFWVYFDAALSPSVWVGGSWPPVGIVSIDPYGLPLLNTVLLLSSGATLTLSHSLFISNRRGGFPFMLTLGFAVSFLFVQSYEYYWSSFSFSDGILGSVFYYGTGFHGFHVLAGSVFLLVCLARFYWNHFTSVHYLGLEFASLYWHFVDVVWIALWLVFYLWGGGGM